MKNPQNFDSSSDEFHQALYTPYWVKVKNLTWKVLGFWVVSILAAVLLAPMIRFEVVGIPLAYWLISGALLLGFLGAVAYYAWQMDSLDAWHQVSTQDRAAHTTDRLSEGDAGNENQQGRSGQPPIQ